MLKAAMMLFALVLVSPTYTLATAESGFKSIEVTGSIVLFNDSPHSGLWAAEVDFDHVRGDIISVSKNDANDIFVVTIKGEDVVFEADNLKISGTAFVTKNGVLLEEGDGTASISESEMQVKMNGKVVVTGQTISFTKK